MDYNNGERQQEIKSWILEELDQNIRLLTAIEAFRFKKGLVPRGKLRVVMLHHQYLLRLLERYESPEHSYDLQAIGDAMQSLSGRLEQDRNELMDSIPEGEKVRELFFDPAWNHKNVHVQLSFAPEEMLRQEQEEKELVEDRVISQHTDLRSALQGLPTHWLKVIHRNLELGDAANKTRSRIIAAVVARLLSGEFVLDIKQEKLVEFVVSSRGVAPYADACALFGDDYVDGFWWDVHPPQTVLGSLRALGILFVGRVSARGEKGILLPLELRPFFGDAAYAEMDNVVIFPRAKQWKKQ